MSNTSRPGSPSQNSGMVGEQDLRDDFQKVNEQVQKVIQETDREVPLSGDENSETVFVVEPVYTYQVHASN